MSVSGNVLIAIVSSVWREIMSDRVMMISAGLAFFLALSLLPALAAVGVIYGSLLDEAMLKSQLERLSSFLPQGTTNLLAEFLTTIPAELGFGLTLAVNLLLVLWTVQRSASGVITALNVAYDVEERRGRFRRAMVALAIAVSGLVALIGSLFLVAILPILLPTLHGVPGLLLNTARWPILAILFMVALMLLYRYAPSHEPAAQVWQVSGPVVATGLWLSASALFSYYVGYAGYGRFYGPVTAVVVFLLWMFIGSLAVMVGAEINAVVSMKGRSRTGVKEALEKRERSVQ